MLTPTAIITATLTMRPASRFLDVGGINPQVGPVAFYLTVQECPHARVQLPAKPADLALEDATLAKRLDQIVTERVEIPCT